MKAASKSGRSPYTPLILLGFGLAAAPMVLGCKKDEAPPPLPSAEVATAPSGETVLTIDEEDAGEDAAEDKPTGSYKAGPSLKACCSALRQNAASAPEPNKGYMLAAAAACDGAVAAGQSRGSVIATVQAALRGAGMPAACH